jgi:flavin-dependent dehydrogenase
MTAAPAVDVLVIGAGPAGAAAARVLGQAGARVELVEAGALPRHKLCGEFVSPEASADLGALGLDLAASGAIPLHAVRVESRGRAAEAPLVAVAIERRVLDAGLVDAAVASGARLRTETRVTHLHGDAKHGFVASLTGNATLRARFVIGAFGARPLELRPTPAATRVARARIALKTHYTGVAIAPRVELHAFAGGYAGVAPVGRDRVNVCVVARPRALARGRTGGGAGALANLLARVPAVAACLSAGEEDPAARCATSGLEFGTARPAWNDVLLCGDAASLPHPLAGDGIAMALRAGRLAAAHVAAALDGRLAPARLAAAYARAWRREFAARLRWDAPLHAVLERPLLAGSLLRVLQRWPRGFTTLVEHTRGVPAAHLEVRL